jgi:ribosomal protein S12 methylthiotransferase
MGSPVQVRPARILISSWTNTPVHPINHNPRSYTVNQIRKSYYIHSLGCNKNTADSEVLMSMLSERGFRRVDEPEDAERVIVNTCAFIDEAKQEAIDTIMGLSARIHEGAALIVTGCFPQLYADEIEEKIPEADIIAGSGDLVAVIDAIDSKTDQRDFPSTRVIPEHFSNTVMRTQFLSNRGYAYLKISEGCSRGCSFCLIPHIKGGLRSRSADEIILEAKHLEGLGIGELILTSQDTLSYGTDLSENRGLRFLIEHLLEETGIPFIRLLYLRPAKGLLRILDLFENNRVVPYFDIPVQHAAENVLKNMNREGNSLYYKKIIDEIRSRIPHAVLRTTLITGFPGEGKDEFEELLAFIKRIRFNHVGAFVFSPQSETRAYQLDERVKTRIAQQRREIILTHQKGISRELLHSEVGKTFDVLIEEKIENEKLYFGRSYHFTPEVDGLFVIESERTLKPGSIVRVKATSAEDYDLHGREILQGV